MTDTTNQSADAIERDIEKTQNSISDTVEQLQERFSPRALMNSVLGDDGDGSDKLVHAAKTNPLGVALMGAGALMLASGRTGGSTRNSITDAVSSLTDRIGGRHRNAVPAEPSDPHHRSYLAHMNAVSHTEGESADDYRRRRDRARSSYFMLEQGHDEEESAFRKRLDDAGEALRKRTSAFGDMLSSGGQSVSDGASSAAGWASDTASSAGSSLRSGGRRASAKAQAGYQQNPLVGGLIAAAVGAILGAVIPETDYEDEMLGEYGDAARSKAGELADTAKAKASDLAEQGKAKAADAAQTALDKADSKLEGAGSTGCHRLDRHHRLGRLDDGIGHRLDRTAHGPRHAHLNDVNGAERRVLPLGRARRFRVVAGRVCIAGSVR